MARLQVSSQDGNWNLKCFQIAAMRRTDELMLASIVAPHTAALAFRAIVNSNTPVKFESSGWDGKWFRNLSRINGQGNYNTATHRLDHGMLHVVVWAKPEHGFLPSVSEESIWQMIRKDHTTPLKREWMPFVMQRLKEKRHLQDCNSAGCECGVLFLDTDSLDAIVSDGLRGKEIVI